MSSGRRVVDVDQPDRLPPLSLAAPEGDELRGPRVGIGLEHMPPGDHRVVRLVLVSAEDQVQARLADEQVAIGFHVWCVSPTMSSAPCATRVSMRRCAALSGSCSGTAFR